MILEAEKRGELKPGGLVVEGTAGNTGIGLALVANARGYRTLIVIPETQSQEKKDMLRLCGAELVEVPAVPYSNPEQLPARRAAARRRARAERAERRALCRPVEQPRQPQGASTCRPGRRSGSRPAARSTASSARSAPAAPSPACRPFLREKKPDIVIGVADPAGAAMYDLFTRGEAKASDGGSITEGIGLGRVTPIIEDIKVDKAYLMPDEEAVPIIFDLLEHEGLCIGGSTGINVAGAIRLAQGHGAGPHHRDDPRRLRHALPVEAVQSRIPALRRACRCRPGWSGEFDSIAVATSSRGR